MKYESELDLDDLIDDFREDYPLPHEKELELRQIAKEVDKKLVEYANSKTSLNPSDEFEAVVFYLNKKFYVDADFGDLPVLLDSPSIGDAANELGYFKEGKNWAKKLIDHVDWCYYWSVRRAE